MQGTSYMRIPEELSIKPQQPKGIGLTISIPFPNFLPKTSRAVNRFVKNGKVNFGSPIEGNPKYSSQKKPKWIFHSGGPFVERLGNLTGPKSYFEIKFLRKVGCVLTSNEVHFVSLAENFTV